MLLWHVRSHGFDSSAPQNQKVRFWESPFPWVNNGCNGEISSQKALTAGYLHISNASSGSTFAAKAYLIPEPQVRSLNRRFLFSVF